MRASTRRAGASFLLAALLTLAVPAAQADDLLVMPYACSMVGGRPLLTPAPEQSHRIIGPREQRTYTACSPVNPDMCRNWTIHRFDVDCEGSRVPWASVVASVAEETTRRAWIEDGRLVLRMPPSWSFEPGDPCARRPSFDDRFGFGRMRRYCADRRAMAPPPIVELPFGFAPMLGIDGIFVKSTGPTGRTAPPPPPAVAAWPPAPPPKVTRAEPSPRPTRVEPAPAHAPRPDPVAKDTPAVTDAPARNAAPPKVAAQPPAPAPAPAAKPSPPAPKAEAPPTATPGGPIVPKIINRPAAAGTDGVKLTRQSAPDAKSASPKAPEVAANTQPPSREASQQTPASDADIKRDTTPMTVGLLSAVRSPTMGVVAFGGLAAVLLAAFALARRRERLGSTPHPHDIASVSLDGRRGRRELAPRAAAAPAPRRSTPAAPSPAPPAADRKLAWVDRIPQTRAEAQQMLGMGVSPDASDAAMKKVVDGLRLSWHPDLAKDDADRQLREFRIKQINAAWDLIQGKRLERLDS